MRKELLWGIGLAVGIGAVVTGLFLLPDDDNDIELSDETVFERNELFSESIGREPEYPESYDFDKEDDLDQVTRIVIDDSKGGSDEISGILSEKVIINDEVVDKGKSQ